MTTIAFSPEGADTESGALDPFKGIAQLLPKLVQPSWYKHVHSGMYHETKHRHETQDPAAEKAKRRVQRKKSRLIRALSGEHTRVSAQATA